LFFGVSGKNTNLGANNNAIGKKNQLDIVPRR